MLLTNLLEFGSTTIAAIYKDRWEIELFFKALKQNLKVKSFVGTSENALRIQIWTALIAILLLKWVHHLSKAKWSLSNLASMLRLNLFTCRDLSARLDNPFGTPPILPESQHLGNHPAPFGLLGCTEAVQFRSNSNKSVLQALQTSLGFLVRQITAMHFQDLACCCQGPLDTLKTRAVCGGSVGLRQLRDEVALSGVLKGEVKLALEVLLSDLDIAQSHADVFVSE